MSQKTPLIIGFEGRFLDPYLEKHLMAINPAGIILFKRNIESLKQIKCLIREIRELLGDLIVSIDFEGGVVSRFPMDVPVPPSAYALSLLENRDLVVESCRIQADLLASLGINLNFAPVLDLFFQTENEAIGTRAFSKDPEIVANFGVDCIKQHTELKVGTSAKHFPGLGRIATDTHYEQGEASFESQELEQIDLIPFKKAIDCSVPSIMLAHLKYSALDQKFPASMSQKIVGEMLRSQMGYDRLVITDCVEMAGISSGFTPQEIIIYGLQAGVDLWVSSFSLKKSVGYQLKLKTSIDHAVQSDEVMAIKLDHSRGRIKAFLRDYSGYPTTFDLEESRKKIKEIHRESIQKIRYSTLTLPSDGFSLIELSNRDFSGINAENGWNVVSKVLRDRCPVIKESLLVFGGNLEAVSLALSNAEERHLIPLLLTANAFRQDHYLKLDRPLKSLKCFVHIALLDQTDLFRLADNEWVTWGFNAMTGQVLADELIDLFTKPA